MRHRPVHSWLDRIGIAGAGLCTVHCAAMPILLLAMPLSAFSVASRGSWQHGISMLVMRLHGYEKAMVAAALLLATASLALGWRRHRRLLPVVVGLFAAASLGSGLLLPLSMSLALHLALLLGGGMLLGVAHWLNFRLPTVDAPVQH